MEETLKEADRCMYVEKDKYHKMTGGVVLWSRLLLQSEESLEAVDILWLEIGRTLQYSIIQQGTVRWIAKDGRYSKEVLERFDEKPMNFAFIPVPAGGTTISLEQDIAIRQFNFIRKKANEEKNHLL